MADLAYDDFTPDELLVSQILLELPLLFSKSHAVALPTWSLRRKRSTLDSTPQPSTPPSKIPKESSPTTPFSLASSKSRSESEENNANAIVNVNVNANANANNAKSSSKKPSSSLNVNKKSQYLEAIDELTKQNQVLKGNLTAMKQNYTHLQTINSELKSKKQEMMMILDSKNKSTIPENGISNSATKIKFTVKSPLPIPPPPPPPPSSPPPPPKNSQNFQIPIGGIPYYDPSSMGPMGIPDLNISHEEITQRNFSRFLAARARQNRIQICKTKNNGATAAAAAKLQS